MIAFTLTTELLTLSIDVLPMKLSVEQAGSIGVGVVTGDGVGVTTGVGVGATTGVGVFFTKDLKTGPTTSHDPGIQNLQRSSVPVGTSAAAHG